MIKFYTIYKVSFLGNLIELDYMAEFTTVEKVYNFIEAKNFEVNTELESELRKDFLTVELKNGQRVNNKKYKLEHLNYKYCVISEYDKKY